MDDEKATDPLIPPPSPEIDLEAGAGDQLQCRICLETDGRDFIAPCKCKGTSKYVHRDCLDHWRAVKEGFAFSHCTTCKAPYYLRVHVHTDRKWRTMKFRFFVTRDILFIFALVQFVISALAYLVHFIDGYQQYWLRTAWGFDNEVSFYYICGALLFFALLGLSGCFITCYDRRVRSDLAQPCRELCLWGGACFAALVAVALAVAVVGAASEGDSLAGIDAAPEVKSLGPLAKGLLNGMPDAAAGPAAMGPVAKYPLVLAEDRTRRPDVLHHLRMYGGGWNITNKHYWASVSFTGVAGFILAALWFISFGIAAASFCFCKSRMGKGKVSHVDVARPVLLVVVVLALIVGCIVLSYGQGEFHEEATKTLDFVVNQSDFTIQTLRNVTDYLSFAVTINVAALYLPPDVQDQINNLKVDLNKASDTISLKTTENYKRIRKVLHNVSVALICIAVLMPVLAFLGYVLELYGPRYTIYSFATLCWIIVAALFILIGILLIVSSAAKDTCQAMDEWAQHPRAETALSNILPCVDESTTNRTLYQSKLVVVQLVTLVNRAISVLSNRKQYHLHPGQLMPYLCSPYDKNLNDRQCFSREVTFDNATTAWQDYTCNAPDAEACSGPMTVTPEVYGQLVSAANASYALHHYAPLMLNFQDCKFVRDTFSSIASQYCPPLERDLRLVSTGLALLAAAFVLGLLLLLFVDRPRNREEVSEPPPPSGFRVTPVDCSP